VDVKGKQGLGFDDVCTVLVLTGEIRLGKCKPASALFKGAEIPPSNKLSYCRSPLKSDLPPNKLGDWESGEFRRGIEVLLDVVLCPVPLDDVNGTSEKLVNFVLPTSKVENAPLVGGPPVDL